MPPGQLLMERSGKSDADTSSDPFPCSSLSLSPASLDSLWPRIAFDLKILSKVISHFVLTSFLLDKYFEN